MSEEKSPEGMVPEASLQDFQYVEDAFDVYINSVFVRTSAYDTTLVCCRQTPMERRDAVGTLRMSHAHAWVLAQLLLKQLGQLVEDQKRPFLVLENTLDTLGLQEEYAKLCERAAHESDGA